MEITGNIKTIKDTQTFETNNFRKRELVLETSEQYPQPLLIEFIQDNCDVLNNFTENQEVKININLKGREWISPSGEAKYFNTFQGWKIEHLKNNAIDNTTTTPIPSVVNDNWLDEDDESYKDLPF